MSVCSFAETVKYTHTLAIDGYIRNMNKTISVNKESFYNYIPAFVNYLCLRYYHTPKDRFDPDLHYSDRSIIVTDDTVMNNHSNYMIVSALLTNVVSANIHHWKFQIISFHQRSVICIGIMKNKFADNPLNFSRTVYYDTYKDYHKMGYALNLKTGYLKGNINGRYLDCHCKEHDVIDMYLDLNNHVLKYSINGTDYGVAGNIESGNYRAAVALYGDHQKTKLSLKLYDTFGI